MSCSFRILRKIWMGFLAVLSIACWSISIFLYPHAQSKGDIWVLISVSVIATWCAVQSIVIKSLGGGRKRSVGIEAMWTLALLPFEIVLVLFLLSTPQPSSKSNPTTFIAFYVLETFVIINMVLVFTYTTTITVLAVLTHLCLDPNVWSRDIDGSPSPFPLSTIRAYIASFFRNLPPTSPRSTQPEAPCLPGGCTCTTKPGTSLSSSPLGNQDWAGSRSHVPIRIPNEMERRSSIAVSFEVLSSAV